MSPPSLLQYEWHWSVFPQHTPAFHGVKKKTWDSERVSILPNVTKKPTLSVFHLPLPTPRAHHAERSLRPAEEDDNDQGDTQHGGKGQAPAQPDCPIRVPVDFVVGQGYILDKREDETSLWRDGAGQRVCRRLRVVWTLPGAGPLSPLSLLWRWSGIVPMDLARENLTKSPAHPPLAPQVSS